jgi:hypothetical protein
MIASSLRAPRATAAPRAARQRTVTVQAKTASGRKNVSGGKPSGGGIDEGARGEEAIAFIKTLPGITAPFPDMFDPAGFTKNKTIRELKRYREAEVTHGRVAMLAGESGGYRVHIMIIVA